MTGQGRNPAWGSDLRGCERWTWQRGAGSLPGSIGCMRGHGHGWCLTQCLAQEPIPFDFIRARFQDSYSGPLMELSIVLALCSPLCRLSSHVGTWASTLHEQQCHPLHASTKNGSTAAGDHQPGAGHGRGPCWHLRRTHAATGLAGHVPGRSSGSCCAGFLSARLTTRLQEQERAAALVEHRSHGTQHSNSAFLLHSSLLTSPQSWKPPAQALLVTI